jgi:ligand-binding sensor domain-containing protein
MRRTSHFILLCTALLALSAPAASIDSPWSAHLWQTDNGPNGNYVSGIVQTPDGFLWVATLNGLTRFDGVKFDNYLPKDFTGDASMTSRVRLLIPRRGGGLWAILDNGPLVSLMPGQPPAIVARNLPPVLAESAIEDRSGAVWIVYHSGPVCRIENGQVTQFGPEEGVPNGNPATLTLDNLGRVWVIKATHVALFRDGRFQAMTDVSSAASHAVAAADGGLYVCADVNLYKYVEGAAPQKLASLRDFTPSMLATVMYQDSAGRLWIGTSFSGLFCYTDSKIEKVPVSNAMVASIAEDSEGNIWVGTRSGLDRIRPRAVALEGSSVGLPFGSVQSICQDPSGQIWAVTPDGFVVRRTQDGWKTELTGIWPGGTATCVAAAPDGTIWIGTRNRKIRAWKDGKLLTIDQNSGVIGHSITALLATRSGDVWIGEFNTNALRSFTTASCAICPLRCRTAARAPSPNRPTAISGSPPTPASCCISAAIRSSMNPPASATRRRCSTAWPLRPTARSGSAFRIAAWAD